MPKTYRLCLSICFFLIFAHCSTLDDTRRKSPHYHDDRFHDIDNDDGITEKSFWSLLKWKLFTPRDPEVIPGAPDESPEAKKISSSDLLAAPGRIRITWIGHATTFISINREGRITNIITDPVFGGIFLVSRRTQMPLAKEDFPEVHLAVVSHSHYDHCDLETLRFLQEKNPQMKMIFPEGQKTWGKLNGLGQAEDMRWWTKQMFAGIEVHFLPAHHWSLRVPGDRMQFHWGSYAFVAGNTAVYFAGDTAYSSHFSRIAEKFPQGFAAAIMPIGAYAPRWFMRASHVDPAETVTASLKLRAKIILPMHWATFKQTDENMMEPILYLQREAKLKKTPCQHWRPGDSYEVDIR